MDIRAASQKVREAYKSYYQLKTLVLQDSLMDITFSDDRENSISLDTSQVEFSATPFEADKALSQSDGSGQHRVVLADIQNDKDIDNGACDSEKQVPNVEGCGRDIQQKQSSEDLKVVWGSHLNINTHKVLDCRTKTLNKRSSSFHFSEKLFVGSKFSKKNPRKSRSFSRHNKSIENDGFTVSEVFEVKKISSEHLPHDCQENFDLQPSSNDRSFADSTRSPNSELPFKGLLEGKMKVVTNSTPITNQAVSAIHRAVLTSESCEQKLTPSRIIDKGWLDRCTKSSSLEYHVMPMNDSGIESMEGSTITDQCSSTEHKPKLLESDCDIVPELVCTKSEENLTPPDVSGNETTMTLVLTSDESDADVICNSEESENEGETVRMRRITCGKRRARYSDADVICNSEESGNEGQTERMSRVTCGKRRVHCSSDVVLPEHSAKKQKLCPQDEPKLVASNEKLIEIPSAVDIDKIADAIVSVEKDAKMKKSAASVKLTKREILEKKVCTGEANDNFVSINIKKKVYVRGKKTNNYSKYKKAEWKKKKKMARSEVDDKVDSTGMLKCFKCGDVGHFARNCRSVEGQ